MTDSFDELDMAIDMSDRYGVDIQDAYEFAVEALEGSLKDPEKRRLRELGRGSMSNPNKGELRDLKEKHKFAKGYLTYAKRTSTSKDDKARISNLKAENDFNKLLAEKRIKNEYAHQRERANKALNKNINNTRFTIK